MRSRIASAGQRRWSCNRASLTVGGPLRGRPLTWARDRVPASVTRQIADVFWLTDEPGSGCEGVGPDVVRSLRAESNAGPFMPPKLPALGLPGLHLQTLLLPNALDARHVGEPSGVAKQAREAAVAGASMLRRRLAGVDPQRRIVGLPFESLASCGSMLPQDPAHQPLRHSERPHGVGRGNTAVGSTSRVPHRTTSTVPPAFPIPPKGSKAYSG